MLKQVELRRKARAKFAAAERMFFTPLGLEQATDEHVAAHKAARFAGRLCALDLCCGIGGDLLALAAACAAVGVDRDPVCAILAEANARAVLGAGVKATVCVQDVADVALGHGDAWHIDPDRRPQGRRTTRVELHDPPAEALEGLLAKSPHAAIKLAPAATWPDHWTPEAEWEWISRGRQCRQLVAWFGDLATHRGQHRATALGPEGTVARSLVALPDEYVPIVSQVGPYLFEPDAAVLAAKLTGPLAAEHELAALASGIHYWTGPVPLDDPLLATFAVEEVVPFDVKKLKALLRARDAGPLEIKVRGVDQDPAVLRKKLSPAGSRPTTLLLAPVAGRVMAIVARRLAPDSTTQQDSR